MCGSPLHPENIQTSLSPLIQIQIKAEDERVPAAAGLALFLWSCSTRHNLIQYLLNQTRTKQKFLSVLQLHLQAGAAALGVTMCKPFPVSLWVNFHKTWVRWRDVISLHKDEQSVTEIKLSDVSIKFQCLVCSFECCPVNYLTCVKCFRSVKTS